MASSAQFLSKPFELIASLWDSPRVAETIAENTTASAAAGGAPSVPAPEQLAGLCGSIHFEAGTAPEFVCGVGGLHIPGFVVFSSFLMLGITAVLLARYLSRSASFAAELELFLKSKGPLRERVSQTRLQSAFWKTLDRRLTENANPDSAAAWSGGPDGFNQWTLGRWVEAFPGWLTSAGLLVTFIAILSGLSKIHVGADLQVQGIAGLINSLAGKFFSSIMALSLALIVSVVDHWNRLRISETWARFEDSLDRETKNARKA